MVYPVQYENLEDNMLGLSVSQPATTVSQSPSHPGTQPNQSSQSNDPPVAPARSRKRNNDVLSPAKAPPATYQRITSPRGHSGTVSTAGVSSVGSPVRSSITPPITDLFACDIGPIAEDHEVYIGSQAI